MLSVLFGTSNLLLFPRNSAGDVCLLRLRSVRIPSLGGVPLAIGNRDVDSEADAHRAVLFVCGGVAFDCRRNADGCWGGESRSGWLYVDKSNQCD